MLYFKLKIYLHLHCLYLFINIFHSLEINREYVVNVGETELVKNYYENMVKAAEKKPDILGHFDLVVKNNRANCFFDEESTEYMDAALASLEECNKHGVIFEVNTGAIVRKKRELPYPSPYLLKKLCEMGGKVTLSADCHDARFITGEFDVGMKVIRDAGFKTVYVWENGKFEEKEI